MIKHVDDGKGITSKDLREGHPRLDLSAAQPHVPVEVQDN